MKKLEDLDETAIEQWCKHLDKCQRREMTKEESKTLIYATAYEKCIEEDPCFDKLVEQGDSMYALIYKHIKHCHTYTAKKSVIAFLNSISTTPGIAVEYCNFIQYKCHQKRIKHVDMIAFSSHLFPEGFFSDADLQQAWDKQKIASDNGSDNMLDYNHLMKSIEKI